MRQAQFLYLFYTERNHDIVIKELVMYKDQRVIQKYANSPIPEPMILTIMLILPPKSCSHPISKIQICCCFQLLSRVLLFCNPTDHSPPGSSVHGIPQARTLERVSISFSRGSSRPRDQTHVSCIDRQILYHWPTREVQNTKILVNSETRNSFFKKKLKQS